MITQKGSRPDLKKTMIYLEEDVRTRLKHQAVDEGVSMSELIRRAIGDYLQKHSTRVQSRVRR